MAKKRRVQSDGMVYSTNKNIDLHQHEDESQTLEPGQQKLYISLDKKQRKGKAVTLVEGFIGTEVDLQDLGKTLKSKCGVGGSVKDGEILVQGDQRDKIEALLKTAGYQTKRKGG